MMSLGRHEQANPATAIMAENQPTSRAAMRCESSSRRFTPTKKINIDNHSMQCSIQRNQLIRPIV